MSWAVRPFVATFSASWPAARTSKGTPSTWCPTTTTRKELRGEMVAAGLVDVTFETQKFWDAQADTFDDEADHGLRDAAVRGAWSRLLLFSLPDVPASVADLGYGTGSLSVLLAQAGYDVAGLDLSTRRLPVTAQVGPGRARRRPSARPSPARSSPPRSARARAPRSSRSNCRTGGSSTAS